MGALCYVEEFAQQEQAAGRAAPTRRNHRRALERLDAWLEGEGLSEKALQPADLVRFVNAEGERVSRGQVNNVVSAVRVYFHWLAEEGLRRDGQNPAARLKYQSIPLKPVESLTDAECKKLVRWATTKAPRERFGVHRTGFLALLLLDTGLRLGEALRLRLCDLDFSEGKLLVRQTKTGDFRVVPISPVLRKQLRRYLQRREERLAKLGMQSEFVILSESGQGCSVTVAEHSFQRIGEAAGIRSVYPHLLRHTFATQSLLNGAPLPAVMRLGGWRKLTTVQRYTYMNDAVAAEVHSRTSPLAAM